jgi:hypothetical protein
MVEVDEDYINRRFKKIDKMWKPVAIGGSLYELASNLKKKGVKPSFITRAHLKSTACLGNRCVGDYMLYEAYKVTDVPELYKKLNVVSRKTTKSNKRKVK